MTGLRWLLDSRVKSMQDMLSHCGSCQSVRFI